MSEQTEYLKQLKCSTCKFKKAVENISTKEHIADVCIMPLEYGFADVLYVTNGNGCEYHFPAEILPLNTEENERS